MGNRYLAADLAILCLGGFIGSITGVKLTQYYDQIMTIREYDVNNDNRNDLIIENRDSKLSIFLRQEDGSYKRIDEVKSEIEARAYSELEKITSKASSN